MAHKRVNENQYYYDVYPLVMTAGCPTEIHIRFLKGKKKFVPGETYIARLHGHSGGSIEYMPTSADVTQQEVVCDAQGGFAFTVTLNSEQEYTLALRDPAVEGRKGVIEAFRLYCVDNDLVGVYPYVGDLHLHSTMSDGDESPEVVCANYRAYGYDFLAITDHRRYYPSLHAINFYKDVPTELNLVPGEEVQLPPRVNAGPLDPHTVSFGADYSVNQLIESVATEEVGTSWETRSLTPDCPPVMTHREFSDLIDKRIAEMDFPKNLQASALAGVTWVHEQIRKAGGLSIYVHPTWITNNAYHIPDAFHDYLVEHNVFDAFEVLGGESYFEQNGFQTVRYYEDNAKGYHYPVVGSTDSHRSIETNTKGFICETIVFSPENERRALIDSIKSFRSVAVDTISAEFRLVGQLRFVRYACFLIKNYLPMHDELCKEEGRLLLQYATGTEEEQKEALKVLEVINGRVQRQREKYFSFTKK